jgi:hypothetical protein
MIIIAGDSWAKGVWADGPNMRQICTHGGLGQLITDSGRRVVNLARLGGTNLDAASRLDSFFYEPNGFRSQVESIIVFQTEWHRDCWAGMSLKEYQQLGFDYNQIKSRIISRFYYRLSEIAQTIGINIHLIGGCSDALWLDKFEKEYPGVSIVCQSMTNLLLSQQSRIDVPVYGTWGPASQSVVSLAKHFLDQKNLSLLLDDIDLGGYRRKNWYDLYNQGLFCDDRVHPNFQANKILYEYLQDKKIL